MMLPAIKMVRNSAMATKCADHLRKMDIAEEVYSLDNDWGRQDGSPLLVADGTCSRRFVRAT